MKLIVAVFLTLLALSAPMASADDYFSDEADTYDHGTGDLYTTEELDDLLAPIALYPDPLIAQILPAATYVDQIDEAARYVRQYGKSARIDSQPWDVSVKAVAHYPSVLFMMDRKYDWTVSLGQAFVNQEQDVMDTIQRLRAEARSAGSLVSTPQQQVIVENDLIRVIPAEPEVIYVPQYDPTAVYVAGLYPSYGYISFGIGFGIGAWLNRDCDWYGHRVYYHGWRGGGWINRARPYVNIRNRAYVNNRYRDIVINRRVVERDNVRFRNELRRSTELPSNQRPRAVPQSRSSVGSQTPSSPPAATRSNERTRRPQGSGLSSPYAGYGGYGNEQQLRTYRQRGRVSRDSMHQMNRQPLVSGQRGSAPAGTAVPRASTMRPSAPSTRSVPATSGNAPGSTRPSRVR